MKFQLTNQKAHFAPNECLTGGPLGSTKYYFWQLELHWGSWESDGSEHTVNFNRFPLELHLVHVKEDYVDENGTVDEIEALEDQNGLAILAIFVKVTTDVTTLIHDNTWFNVIAEAAKTIANTPSQASFPSISNQDLEPSATINLGQIIFRINPTFNGEFNYWYYNGSKTSPDCNEAVRWIIAENPLEITTEQVRQI